MYCSSKVNHKTLVPVWADADVVLTVVVMWCEFISSTGPNSPTLVSSHSQQDQLYTWAAVSQPPQSMEHIEGRIPGQIRTLWPPPRPGGEDRPGQKYTEAGR